VLRRLRHPAVYEELERHSARLEAGLSEFGRVQRVGAMLTFFASGDAVAGPVTRMQALETARYAELFRHLLDRETYVAPSQYECLFPSLAHGDAEVDALVGAVADFFA